MKGVFHKKSFLIQSQSKRRKYKCNVFKKTAPISKIAKILRKNNTDGHISSININKTPSFPCNYNLLIETQQDDTAKKVFDELANAGYVIKARSEKHKTNANDVVHSHIEVACSPSLELSNYHPRMRAASHVLGFVIKPPKPGPTPPTPPIEPPSTK